MFYLFDSGNIARCLASEKCNLWIRVNDTVLYLRDQKDEDAFLKEHGYTLKDIERGGTVGDEFNGTWIAHPENYPKPSAENLKQQAIALKTQIKSLEELEKDGVLCPEKADLQTKHDAIIAELKK